MSKYYKRIGIDAEGNSAEPVNFVGVHPLRWNRSDRSIQGNTPPDAGFVEADVYEKEFVEWIAFDGLEMFPMTGKTGDNEITWFDLQDGENTLTDVYEYWLTEIKGK